MRSPRRDEDLTARARIRDQALALFALSGPDLVSVRQIAAAAGVSPALVLHHFGSKQGLREAIDAHVAEFLEEAMAPIEQPEQLTNGRAVRSVGDVLTTWLPEGSPLPGYLRWSLLSGDAAGRALFRRWFEHARRLTDDLTAAGLMRPSADPDVRTAFLLANDLALLVLRDQLAEVLGTDPLSSDGARRWVADVVAAYTQGVFTSEVS